MLAELLVPRRPDDSLPAEPKGAIERSTDADAAPILLEHRTAGGARERVRLLLSGCGHEVRGASGQRSARCPRCDVSRDVWRELRPGERPF